MCGHFLKVLQRPVLHTMKEIHIKRDVQIFSWLLILIKTSLTSFPEGPPSDMFFLIYVKVVIQRTPRPSESTWTENFCVEMEADGENRIWATRGRDLVMFTSATQMERMLHMPSSLSVCVCDSSVLSMDKSASVRVFQFESAVDGAVPVPSLQTSGSKLIGTATLWLLLW